MRKKYLLLFLIVIIATIMTSCTGVSQEDYDGVISNLNSINNKYIQTRQENNNLKTELGESSKKLAELQARLTQSEQTISSLQAEIEKYKATPLKTDVVIQNRTIIRGRTVVVGFNYFERIEGKVIGDGFRAYLKEKSTGNIILDMGTKHEREFSFTPPDPFIDYYIDYEIIDSNSDNLPCTVAYVLFY